MTTMKVRGARRRADRQESLLRTELFDTDVRTALDLGLVARSTQNVEEVEVQDDDVLEVDLGEGLVLWTSVAQYREDADPEERRSLRDATELPTRLARRAPATRGLGAWVVQGLKVLGITNPLEDKLATLGARKVAKLLEGRLATQPGLYRWDGQALLGDPLEASDLSNGEPWLVFLHGTASHTEGSFSKLRTAHAEGAWEKLTETYPDRILAFEHRTLSESPIENAVELLEALPPNAHLHLVSHSRGGLVGEMLGFGGLEGTEPFGTEELARFAPGNPFDKKRTDEGAPELPEDAREKDLIALRRLNELLLEKQPQVERFVRVACPALGTTLASHRLDLWLSGMIRLLELAGLGNSAVFGVTSDLVVAVAKKRMDPRELPGIEAMMPDSPLVHLLNTYRRRLQADLSVIAGDFDGSGLLARVGEFITDRFYGEDHDFVVPTSSMKLGVPRERRSRVFFAEGPKVHHLSYFQRTETVRPLVEALLRDDDTSDVPGFEPGIRGATVAAPPRSSGSPRPVVFVLPGIMGSDLMESERQQQIWVDLSELAWGGLERLGIDRTGIEASGLRGGSYGKIVEYLAASHEVEPMPYDWRLSVGENAKRLAERLRDTLERTAQPVRILAHSMGGLVARAMILQDPELWDDITARDGGRLIMAGTPNGGSYSAVRVLLGKGRTIRGLALLDLRHDLEELLAILNRFPGLLELLPRGEGSNHLDPATWKPYRQASGNRWEPPPDSALSEAGKVWASLDQELPHRDRILYLAGWKESTPSGIEIDAQGIRILASNRGDGTVLWEGSIPPGVATWYQRIEHGRLLDHPRDFEAIRELLETGVTSRLPTAPPVARGREQVFELPEDSEAPLQSFPGEDELLADLLGRSSILDHAERKGPQIEIQVCHGDLRYARHPVAVGHYEGDDLAGAERALDQRLDGRLAYQLELGIYPGEIGTCAVFLREEEEKSYRGAVVIGLGKVGDLSPQHLVATVEKAALRYSLEAAEAGVRHESEGLALSTLLIGSGEGGVGVEASVQGILRGIHLANQKLVGPRDSRPASAPIQRLEIVELYKDRALQALYALRDQETRGPLADSLMVDREIETFDGSRRRIFFEEDDSWWTRLTVRASKRGQALSYTALTNRARAEETEISIQPPLLDQILGEALTGSGAQAEQRRALFELLLPVSFKQSVAEHRRVMLVLNEDSAIYPWEMLLDRAHREGDPISVSPGLLRTLIEVDPPPVSHPAELNALVVGDPTPEDDPDFPVLNGAVDEANVVDRLLDRNGWNVTTRIRGRDDMAASSIMTALLCEDFRVLHLAGHGVFDPRDRHRTGMVIGNGTGETPEERAANRVLLTPSEIAQMRLVPELVFINCCHLGQIARRDRHRLAANLAAQFIRQGVKAVVAAGWEVDDHAAATFARVFYDELLRGRSFGDAVTAAREEIYRRYSATNTWGAYQCYGNPGFCLLHGGDRIRPSTRKPSEDSPEPFLDPEEVLVDLGNLASRAQGKGRRKQALERLKSDLETIEKRIPARWLDNAQLHEAQGRAWAELKEFQQAIEHYEQARILDEKGEVSTRCLEQLANLNARQAADDADAGRISKNEAARIIRRAVEQLEALRTLGESNERWSLLGSAYKRLVSVSPRKTYLASMAAAYAKAALRNPKDLYPVLNALLGTVLIGGPWIKPEGSDADNPFAQSDRFEEVLEAALKEATVLADQQRSFWSLTYGPDAKMVRALHHRDVHQQVSDLEAAYRQLFQDGSPREHASVIDQLRFAKEWFGKLARASGKNAPKSNEVKALAFLIASLEPKE